jgi:uncharacterized protein with GYD domain
MAIYITQGHYTREAISGMVATPEDRSKALKKLVEAAGGKLINWYLTFGEYDFIAISEFPDDTAAAGVVLAAAAGGGVTDLKTAVAMSGADAMKAFHRAGELAPSFKSAGQTKAPGASKLTR